jgi:trans-aconitate methyltransferase
VTRPERRGSADAARHWDEVHQDRGAPGVSWFQSQPTLSFELIRRLGVESDASVIDVGGGASSLVDHLLETGFTDVSLLDVSETALEAGRRRLGAGAWVNWLCEDISSWRPARRYGLWHDRAMFHFLVGDDERGRYLEVLRSGLEPGGALVLATFAEDGPHHCSGLAVA